MQIAIVRSMALIFVFVFAAFIGGSARADTVSDQASSAPSHMETMQNPLTAPQTPPGGTPRFARIDPAKAAKQAYEEYLDDQWEKEKQFYKYPDQDYRARIESYAPNKDLKPYIEDFIYTTDRQIKELNRLLAEAENAAVHCDRAAYDAAISALIGQYVKTSMHIQRSLESMDSFAAAYTDYKKILPFQDAKQAVYDRWSEFWLGVLDVLSSAEDRTTFAAIKDRNDLHHRVSVISNAYSSLYIGTLERIEKILETADYPKFQPCEKDADGEVDEIAPEEGEALEAQRKALDEFDGEVDVLDAKAANLLAQLDKAVEDSAERYKKSLQEESETGVAQESPVTQEEQGTPLPDGGPMTAVPQWENADAAIKDPSQYKVPDTNLPKIGNPSGDFAAMHKDPCGLDADKVCSVLLQEFRKDCKKELGAFLNICRKGPAIKDCRERCDANWQQGQHSLALAELAKKHIYSITKTSGDDHADDIAEIQEHIKANEQIIQGIKDSAKKRVLQIYIDESTDTVIHHRGKPFKPNPPLRHAGTAGGELYLPERIRIADLEAENKALEKLIDDLADGAAGAGGVWQPMALSKWQADKAVGRCSAVENDANRDACIADCQKGIVPTQECYASVVPQLALPYARPWLYPPGHPMAKPESAK